MNFEGTSFEDCVFVNILWGFVNTLYHLLSICSDCCSSHMLFHFKGKHPHKIFSLICHKRRTENLEAKPGECPIIRPFIS